MKVHLLYLLPGTALECLIPEQQPEKHVGTAGHSWWWSGYSRGSSGCSLGRLWEVQSPREPKGELVSHSGSLAGHGENLTAAPSARWYVSGNPYWFWKHLTINAVLKTPCPALEEMGNDQAELSLVRSVSPTSRLRSLSCLPTKSADCGSLLTLSSHVWNIKAITRMSSSLPTITPDPSPQCPSQMHLFSVSEKQVRGRERGSPA